MFLIIKIHSHNNNKSITVHRKKVCYCRMHWMPRVKLETRILPIGVGAFGAKFYGNGVISSQNVDTVR